MRIVWDNGGEATVTAVQGDKVEVLSSKPSPPGSRLTGVFEGSSRLRIRLKVHGCKRTDVGFAIHGRLLDGTRELLAWLHSGASKETPSTSS
jgi:hypothetical protein